MDIDDLKVEEMPRSDPSILPSDVLGRTACFLIGSFFGLFGAGTLALLIANRRGLDAFVIYELSAVATLLGATLVIWSLFMPRCVVTIARHVLSHFLWIVMVMFVPFAIHAIVLLSSGRI